MRDVAYDHFYSYDELTETLRAWAGESPSLCSVESIGTSYEGRDIWLVTVTNTETGDHLDKPGFLIEANIHSMEWTGCTAALHLIHRLLTEHGKDDRVTRALDTRVFYVIPRLNPDGAERGLKERRFIRSSVRPYPREQQDDGLRVEDVDGDGRVLDMRIEDPNGAWKRHSEVPQLLVRREPLDGREDGPFYRLLPEGRIENYDGVTIKIPPPLEGLDLNRNFPADWAPEHEQRGAGPYPGSEPEVRAMLQAVTDRPNITGHVAYHTFSGVHLRPYAGRPDDDFPTDDLRAYKLIGEEGTARTGYPAVSVFHDFKYHPKESIKGGAHDWMYDHLGVFSWTTEFWSPQRQAGITDYHYTDWIREHPIEDDVTLFKWFDEHYPGAFVDSSLPHHVVERLCTRPCSCPTSVFTSPPITRALSGTSSSTSIGRTAPRSTAFAVTCVGSQPEFCKTRRTRNAPSPSRSTSSDRASSSGEIRRLKSAQSECGAISCSSRSKGTLNQ